MKKKVFDVIAAVCFSLIIIFFIIEKGFDIRLFYTIPRNFMYFLLAFIGLISLAVFFFSNKIKFFGGLVAFAAIMFSLPSLLIGVFARDWNPETCELISLFTERRFVISEYNVNFAPALCSIGIDEPIIPYVASKSTAFVTKRSSEPLKDIMQISENADEIVILYYADGHCVKWIFDKETDIWNEK